MQFFKLFFSFFIFLIIVSRSGSAEAVKSDVSKLILGQARSLGPRPIDSALFTYPQAAIMDRDGTIYIANSLGLSVEKVHGNSIQTILGQLNPDSKGFNRYNDIAFDVSGGLLVADGDSGAILRLDLANGAVKKFADGPTVKGGHFFISTMDYQNERVLIAGIPVRAGSASTNIGIGPSKAYEFDGTSWHAVLDAETASGVKTTIRDIRYESEGGYVALIGEYFVAISKTGAIRRVKTGKKTGGGIVKLPDGWLISGQTELLKVSADVKTVTAVPIKARLANGANLFDVGNGRILVTDSDRGTVYLLELETGEILRQIGNIGRPNKIVSLSKSIEGNLLLLDNAAPRIMQFDRETEMFSDIAGDGFQGWDISRPVSDFSFQYPNCMAVGLEGEVYVTEANFRIVRIRNGRVSVFAGDIHAGAYQLGLHRLIARFGALRGVAVDKEGRVWVVDRGNHSVFRLGLDGWVTRIMGTGKPGIWKEGELAATQPLNSPYGILIRDNGSILIADTQNSVIAEINNDGRVSRFAGEFKTLTYQGQGSYTGDGGQAHNATFNTPIQLSEDEVGNIYVVDQFNNAVRRIAPDGIITTVAGGKFGVADAPERMNHPTSALPIDNHLFIADTGNNAVWAVPLK